MLTEARVNWKEGPAVGLDAGQEAPVGSHI